MAATEQIIRERKRADALMQEGFTMGEALRIARAELEREGKLVEALRRIEQGCTFWPKGIATDAIVAYEAEFAPKRRTLAEVAKDIQAWRNRTLSDTGDLSRLMDELAEALKEAKRG